MVKAERFGSVDPRAVPNSLLKIFQGSIVNHNVSLREEAD
jgi:hypothetical protein